MGIYAALFDSGSVSFETGLTLINIAYQSLSGLLKGGSFGMGTLIGLNGSEIQLLIDKSALRIEITNQNGSHAFVVSGYRNDIQKLMIIAHDEGALHVRELSVSIPYHSSQLKECTADFTRQIRHLEIKPAKNNIISLVDQLILSSPENIRLEIVRNLFQHLNWFRTMQVILEHHVTHFIECGPSKGLARNAKFVEGVKFSALS